MSRTFMAMVSLVALAAPWAAQAQSVGYGDVSGSGSATGANSGSGSSADEGDAFASKKARRGQRDRDGQRGKSVTVQPYIEANQIVDAQLSPGDDVLTYSQAVVGVDAGISGRNTAASASVRYEYHYGWGKKAGNGNSLTGIASGYTTVAPGLTLNAAGLASRIRNDGNGGGLGGTYSQEGADVNVYAIQGGPSLATRVGDLSIGANYRLGFTKIDTDWDDVDGVAVIRPDTFDESISHVADVQAGFAPGTILPVGIGAAGSFYQEDVNLLDQRVRDAQARAIVTVPVGRTVQVTGAIGYENVEISARDAVRNADGSPVIGRDGTYVSDTSRPRFIAYETDGLIWDVGVMWRPSRRTALTAHVGRRYGTMNYTGSFSYAPTARTSVSVGVYNTVSAFGGNLGRILDDLPDDFVAVRNPITGDLTGCVSSLEGNNCLAGGFGSRRSSVFRARGVAATYSMRFGAFDAGFGLGYDNRKYIAAPGTVLAVADGQTDENFWMNANLGWTVDDRSGWYANAYGNVLKSDALLDDITNIGATLAYYRAVTAKLRAHAAVGIDGTLNEGSVPDFWTASALLGMRYNF